MRENKKRRPNGMIKMKVMIILFILMAVIGSLLYSGESQELWQKVDIKNPANLYSVFGTSWNNVYAIGSRGAMLHWNGSEWNPIQITGVEKKDKSKITLKHGVLTKPDQGWVVGDYDGIFGRIFKFENNKLHLHTSMKSLDSSLHGIAAINFNEAFAVGQKGRIFRYDGKKWEEWNHQLFSQIRKKYKIAEVLTLGPIAVHPKTGVYLCYCYFYTQGSERERILGKHKYQLLAFDIVHGYVTVDFCNYGEKEFAGDYPYGKDIFIDPKTGYMYFLKKDSIVGKFRYTSDDQTSLFANFPPLRTSPGGITYDLYHLFFNSNLNGVWMLSPKSGWFVGDKVIYLETISNNITINSYSPCTEVLNDIWMDEEGYGFIVGDAGTILKLDKSQKVQYRLSPEKWENPLGNPLMFILEKTSSGTSIIRECNYTIYKIVENERIPVYSHHFKADNFFQETLNKGKKAAFVWDQRDDQGKFVLGGDYRIEFDLNTGIAGASFSILRSSKTPDLYLSGKISLKTNQDQYTLGETILFYLSNGKKTAISLTDGYYVIEKENMIKGKVLWVKIKDSKKDLFGYQSLSSGEKNGMVWNMTNNRGEIVKPGKFKIKLFLPNEQKNPFIYSFKIAGKRGTL